MQTAARDIRIALQRTVSLLLDQPVDIEQYGCGRTELRIL